MAQPGRRARISMCQQLKNAARTWKSSKCHSPTRHFALLPETLRKLGMQTRDRKLVSGVPTSRGILWWFSTWNTFRWSMSNAIETTSYRIVQSFSIATFHFIAYYFQDDLDAVDTTCSSTNDPLSLACASPSNETLLERGTRKRAEVTARCISRSIDKKIYEGQIARRGERPVKVLLIGQNESDKVALLRGLAFRYARNQWTKKLLSWRAIIYLKLIRDVINVLDLLGDAMARAVTIRMDAPDLDEGHHFQAEVYEFTKKYCLLQLHLAPLRGVRDMLEECIAWVDDAAEVLVGCKEYIQSLWRDIVVNEILACKKFKTSTFDHADIDRIASLDYEPSNDDIIEAGYRTMAVQEHKFIVGMDDEGDEQEWIFYDIADVKSSRLSWAPFFDGVDTIVFFSSISCFDERLSEDCRMNRLEDSFCLWRAICSSSILAKSQILLFLTGRDALNNKIQRGVLVSHHVPNFGDRRNDTNTVLRYFLQHFREISKISSPVLRPVYVNFTSENDVTTAAVVVSTGHFETDITGGRPLGIGYPSYSSWLDGRNIAIPVLTVPDGSVSFLLVLTK
ncbi:G-protein alpha subunit-domain-containing protein [Scleroderma citrinum]